MKQYHLTKLFAIISFGVVLINSWPHVKQHQLWFITILFIGFFAFFATLYMIPKLKTFMLNKNICGLDLNKKGSKLGQIKVPESIGFASATAFILSSFVFCIAIEKIVPQNFLITHLACSLTIVGTILLGFADDMIQLPWRYKLFLPFFIVLPVVTSYTTSTIIYFPYPIRELLGTSINIGFLYYIYLTLLGIYSTNAINIYAGINGLQVGQSIIVAGTQLLLIAIRVCKSHNFQKYSYSIFLLTVFLGSALALMKHNEYPSKVFVGDTFCYYSGIVIAIAAMMSQTGIIVQFLLIPQLINFLYSIPQLFGFYQCPRHRLPKHNENKDTLQAVKTNMNLLNLALLILGPTHQQKLCKKLLYFQILCAIPILVISIFYDFS